MKWLTIVEREILQVNHASTSSYSFSILVSNVFTVQWITLYQNIQPLCAVDYFHYFLLFSLLGDYFEKSYNFVDLLYTILNISLTLFFFTFYFCQKNALNKRMYSLKLIKALSLLLPVLIFLSRLLAIFLFDSSKNLFLHLCTLLVVWQWCSRLNSNGLRC